MRRRPRWTLVPIMLVWLLTVSCTREPPGGEQTVAFGSEDVGEPEASTGEADFGAWSEGDVGGALPDPAGPGGSAGGAPGGAGNGAAAPQAPGEAAPPPGATAAAGAQRGVEGRTVKIAFHHQVENCGGDPNQQNPANEKGLTILDLYVSFFNEHVLAPHNWQLEHVNVDDGGLQCPEKASAAALQITREIKPFAVLGSSINPDRGPVLADEVTREGIPHIGTNWQTTAELQARRGLAYPLWGIAERQMVDLVGFIDRRVKGTKVPNASGLGPEEERVYGLLTVDSPDGRRIAQSVREAMARIGIDISPRIYLIHGDMGVAAQTASNTALKMRQDGVNTLLWGMYAGAGSTYTMSQAMGSQNYLPDILIGTFGLAFFDQLHDPRVWANARGISQLPPVVLRTAVTLDGVHPEYSEVNENSEGYIEVYREAGYNDQPQDGSAPAAYDTWAQLSLLVSGIIHAGDHLTDETFARAVNSTRPGQPNRCTHQRFIGRDWKHGPRIVWGTHGTGGAEGYTTVYWDGTKRTSFGTLGVYESYDNYLFFSSADELPAEPSHDTGQRPPNIEKQPRIGLTPFTPCSQFPDYRG